MDENLLAVFHHQTNQPAKMRSFYRTVDKEDENLVVGFWLQTVNNFKVFQF